MEPCCLKIFVKSRVSEINSENTKKHLMFRWFFAIIKYNQFKKGGYNGEICCNIKVSDRTTIYYSKSLAYIVGMIALGFMGANILLFLVWGLVGLIADLLFAKSKENDLPIERIFLVFRLEVVAIVIGMALSFVKWLNRISSMQMSSTISLLAIFMIGICAVLVLFDKNSEKTEKVREILNVDALDEARSSDLDVVICKDEKTGKDVVLHLMDRYLHMLIIGATGTGKTSQILLKMLSQDIDASNRSIVVLEPKGDFAEQAYAMAKLKNKKTLYFCPKNIDCPSFNPLYGEEDAVVENMCKTFNALNKSNNMYFQVMAENLLRNSLMVLKRLEAQKSKPGSKYLGKPATLLLLNSLIHNSNGEGLKMVSEFLSISNVDPLEKKQNSDIGAWFKSDYFGTNSKIYENTSIVRAQVSKLTSNKYLRKCLNPETDKPDIVFDEILEDDIVLAIGTEKGLLQDLGSYLGLFMFLSYQAAIFRRSGTPDTRKPNLFFCDEFQEYADSSFKEILTQGRSYCVSAVLATQARAQMGINMDAHNSKVFIEVVSANARNVILFPGASPEDAEYYSKKFGQVLKKQIRKGVTRQKFDVYTMFSGIKPATESEQETDMWDAEHTATDLMFKDFGTITYQIIQNKTLQRARVGKASFIDRTLGKSIEQYLQEYRTEQEEKRRVFEEETKNGHYSYQEKSVEEDTDNGGTIGANRGRRKANIMAG